ncbi:leucyl/phenylalanyl-tRNA--protein transferase [Aurantiacibacter spongiae]|uniref:Leucyl/phenylalanyl-tRNA--protein transferase n=1 Tax=Aurantiacibacter spongiae TaxID=2488860 RepID=A0A3N5DHD2_9SPHN|nr:leucyl/phenylalanyl-tRNA--protein transferase [Aurantiacibacter spongiae]RPF71072.1 leucyl/phenylalanyl-tRNA--protein transferase [Aurantiacibacter spongiae]
MHAPTSEVIPPEVLLLAYRSGVFPMADSREDDEVFWVEPRHRAILPLDGFHCSRSLAKIVRRDRYRVTVDADFGGVVEACAGPRADGAGTWISHKIAASYRNLHHHGGAHSIECWEGERLVGGLYGVSLHRAFCGESMFSRADNASKVALAWLVALLRRAGYTLLDCQFMTEHLASLGAVEIPREEYLARLSHACDAAPAEGLPAAHARLLQAAASASSAGGPPSSPGKLIAQSFTQTS